MWKRKQFSVVHKPCSLGSFLYHMDLYLSTKVNLQLWWRLLQRNAFPHCWSTCGRIFPKQFLHFLLIRGCVLSDWWIWKEWPGCPWRSLGPLLAPQSEALPMTEGGGRARAASGFCGPGAIGSRIELHSPMILASIVKSSSLFLYLFRTQAGKEAILDKTSLETQTMVLFSKLLNQLHQKE